MALHSQPGKPSGPRWASCRPITLFSRRLALRFCRDYFRLIAAKLRVGASQIEHHAFISDLESRKIDWRVEIELRGSRESNDVFGHGHIYTSVAT